MDGAVGDRPFEVLSAPERGFNAPADLSQRGQLPVGQGGCVLVGVSDVLQDHRAGLAAVAMRLLLGAEFLTLPCEGRLLDPVAVRSDVTFDDAFAEPVRRGDVARLIVPCDGIDRHHHAGDLGRDHPLDDDAHREVLRSDPELRAVADRLGGEQARPAAQDVLLDVIGTLDPEIGVLLAGERRLGGVLRGRARADGDGNVVAELEVGDVDLGGNLGREHLVAEQLADSGRDAAQLGRGRAVGDRRRDLLGQAGGLQTAAVRVGRDREAGGNGKPFAEQGAEADRLAADAVTNAGRAVREGNDVPGAHQNTWRMIACSTRLSPRSPSSSQSMTSS